MISEWKVLTNDSFRAILLDGSHFFIHDHAELLGQIITSY